MGSGSWSSSSFNSYTSVSKGMSADDFSSARGISAQVLYKSRSLDPVLDPDGVMRECCDSEEHPNTLPVILALDVTGSMGGASVKVAQKLGKIMEQLYDDDSIADIEFCIMGIGDLYCDDAPIQMSQFESDVRIAEQLDKIYFEAGGGGNTYESYTAAWYMGSRHCKLDCWNRGQKGIIITLGDEMPNPYLPEIALERATGDSLQASVTTEDIKEETFEKFDVYHIAVDDSETSYRYYNRSGKLDKAWKELVGAGNYKVANLNNLDAVITDIIVNRGVSGAPAAISSNPAITVNEDNEVIW